MCLRHNDMFALVSLADMLLLIALPMLLLFLLARVSACPCADLARAGPTRVCSQETEKHASLLWWLDISDAELRSVVQVGTVISTIVLACRHPQGSASRRTASRCAVRSWH